MESISLAQAWPYIVSALVCLGGLLATFIWRYVDRNDKEHAEICAHNNEQHKDFYDRLRHIELELERIKAEHECNHD